MDQHLSWRKAYIVSAAVHLVVFILFAIGLAVVVAEKEQVYEIDLQASDFSQGSGHAGGGGGAENLFPEPLKAEEVAKRVETVQQTVPVTTPTETAVPTPDAVNVPQAPSSSTDASTSSVASSSETGDGTGTGGGSGSGTGTGTGDGTGDGHGIGDGSGAGQGSGDGNVSGTGSAPFDTNGFWAAVNANKEYPYMAMKRRLEGTTTIVTTISASGAITSVSVASSSGHGILDDAAVAAAYAVGSYPNPTGGTVSVTTNVSFSIR
ncbi:TonB-dependent receptor [Selenomonas sp. oral taxon 892 str. F0426]|uniref:energy transducer TonB n=1 Tax=Selenomonas sp. oral taxon 892 TaxID=1321785 RepID=UPI0003AD46FD|nr:energy transducer TonB [Selenomonas sp. oral taxon 892]ERJ92699.1 TonB-dependent receptor [Selenomonas sp. oral taxon 892 str. F0426]